MPVDLEMILSASPPLFNNAAFMDFRYSPFHNHRQEREHQHKLDQLEAAFREMRPCLSPTKTTADYERGLIDGCKKRVWFADDKGLALATVKIMNEPSNCPPKWTDDFLEQITKGIRPHVTSESKWEPAFTQPASDYLEFRSKLQRNCVSLENVIIRDGEDNVAGTIKVKNLAFDKEVLVRISFDRWHSSTDVPATYAPSGVEGGTSLYDTFSFSFAIPPSAIKFESVEFCVCFKCAGVEYWDNNEGVNYKLVVKGNKEQSSPFDVNTKPINDAFKVHLDSWSEFASWSHLITEGPYW